MMTIEEFARDYPLDFFAALDSLDINRLAVLAQRTKQSGPLADNAAKNVSDMVLQAIDAAKHEVEQRLNVASREPFHWPDPLAARHLPRMLRRQAD